MRNSLIYVFAAVSLSAVFFDAGVVSAAGFDYSTYAEMMSKYAKDGTVDYLRWKKLDSTAFERYIKTLESASIEGMNDDERKAFWINAYNSLTIYGVLNHIPNNRFLARAFSVLMVPGFFDKIKYKAAGQLLSLNDIENERLRGDFNDPRVHFTIVCASRSCPKIQSAPFTADGLEKRLDESAERFIRDTKRNRLDRDKNVLYLSKIFKWFGEDFKAEAGSVQGFLKRYLQKGDLTYLSGHKVNIKYLYYDWLVNIKN